MALGQTNTREMQLQLEGQLDDISELVDRIDARSAEATMPEDKEKIFAAVEELPGGFLRCPRPPGAVKRP